MTREGQHIFAQVCLLWVSFVRLLCLRHTFSVHLCLDAFFLSSHRGHTFRVKGLLVALLQWKNKQTRGMLGGAFAQVGCASCLIFPFCISACISCGFESKSAAALCLWKCSWILTLFLILHNSRIHFHASSRKDLHITDSTRVVQPCFGFCRSLNSDP